MRAGAEGLFKQVLLNRRLSMPYADEHTAAEQLAANRAPAARLTNPLRVVVNVDIGVE